MQVAATTRAMNRIPSRIPISCSSTSAYVWFQLQAGMTRLWHFQVTPTLIEAETENRMNAVRLQPRGSCRGGLPAANRRYTVARPLDTPVIGLVGVEIQRENAIAAIQETEFPGLSRSVP